jgi:hypothetical protein
MTTNRMSSSTAGLIAWAAGISTLLATLLIIAFYTVGGPYGTLNDIFNGVAGILSGLLAWMLSAQFLSTSSWMRQVAPILAAIGAVVVVIGSILIIFDFTGWMLAGWYTTVGNALIGIWLFLFSYSGRQSNLLPHNISTFGSVVGAIMSVGIIAIAGILTGVDSEESVPVYLNLAYLGYVGTYLLYPAWAIWLGRRLLSK